MNNQRPLQSVWAFGKIAIVVVLLPAAAFLLSTYLSAATSPDDGITANPLPPPPLHPLKVVLQVLIVGGLMTFWTFRPDPLRRVLQIGIGAEVVYAMLQDQISARLCPEYFTVAHPRIEGLTDPTLLGIAWGFLGAWWGGALIGALAGFAAQLGRWPKLNPRELLRPFALLLAAQAFVTGSAGWAAVYEVRDPSFAIVEPLASHIPAERHKACFIVSRIHQGTYISAIAGGALLCGWVLRRRWAIGLRDGRNRSLAPPTSAGLTGSIGPA